MHCWCVSSCPFVSVWLFPDTLCSSAHGCVTTHTSSEEHHQPSSISPSVSISEHFIWGCDVNLTGRRLIRCQLTVCRETSACLSSPWLTALHACVHLHPCGDGPPAPASLSVITSGPRSSLDRQTPDTGHSLQIFIYSMTLQTKPSFLHAIVCYFASTTCLHSD